MNVCFIMYPWDQIDPENDTSLALIKECAKRNHGVAMCTPANLTIRDSVTSAFCTVVGRMDKVPTSLKSFYKKAELREEMLPLAGFDAIFFRANPPLDPIMLNFLDSVKDDVFIINSLEGMREANNKLYATVQSNPERFAIHVKVNFHGKNQRLIYFLEEGNLTF